MTNPLEKVGRVRRSRVTFVMADLGGGTGDHVLSMIRLWDRAAWDARILTSAPLASRHTPEVPVAFVGMKGAFARFPLAQIVTQIRVGRTLRRHPADVVHTYFFWSIMYGRFLKKIGLVRNLVENREDEGFAWGDREYDLLRRTRHLPDRVICVSAGVRRVALGREGLDPARTVVIHNGVQSVTDTAESTAQVRRELGYDADVPLVGMVANLNRPIKGIRYFLDAVPLILRAVPRARFVIFGGGFGQGGTEAELRAQVASLGITEAVQFAGFRPDIERYYPALDVSVLTSLSEGLSIAVLESMNHGLPVVVTSVGGNPEIVRDGETGFLVPPKEPLPFAQRVVTVLEDPALRARMGAAGQRRIREHFDLRLTAERYLALYDELLCVEQAD